MTPRKHRIVIFLISFPVLVAAIVIGSPFSIPITSASIVVGGILLYVFQGVFDTILS